MGKYIRHKSSVSKETRDFFLRDSRGRDIGAIISVDAGTVVESSVDCPDLSPYAVGDVVLTVSVQPARNGRAFGASVSELIAGRQDDEMTKGRVVSEIARRIKSMRQRYLKTDVTEITRHRECVVERRKLVRTGTLDLNTGTIAMDDVGNFRIETCGVPLFSDADSKLGVCRSCLRGWEVDGNRPTEAGTRTIETARRVREAS